MFGSKTRPGLILIMPNEYKNLEEMRREALQGIVDQNGTRLSPSSDIKSFGKNGLELDYSGTIEWNQASVHAIGLLSPHQSGATILVAVEPQYYNEQYTELARSIARSMTFAKPEFGPMVEQWKQQLGGCRLTYMSSYNSGYGGGGYMDKTIIDLCPQGFFNYKDASETTINAGDYAGGYSYSRSAGAGTWKVIGRGTNVLLRLKFHNEEVYEYSLAQENGKTYLNGKRYFRTCDPNDSVAEARPQCW
ncbi:MAG: hypothetical protein GWN59_00635 [Calditrichae bacterium]|nr:hypothetical protein [Calditrichia bacterium]NIV71922.1 hypothetical protein [Calditrichia bacterium]